MVVVYLLDAVSCGDHPVGGDQRASTDVTPAPTSVRLERDLSGDEERPRPSLHRSHNTLLLGARPHISVKIEIW